MILLLVKTPIGLSLALPTDAKGNITATKAQLARHAEMSSMSTEWGQEIGRTSTDALFRVIIRGTPLAIVKSMINKYKLPITILHAQDAYESDTGKVTTVNGIDSPVMTTHIHQQGLAADILPFMPDVITYDPKTMKETSRTKAIDITIPNCSDMAAWVL